MRKHSWSDLLLILAALVIGVGNLYLGLGFGNFEPDPINVVAAAVAFWMVIFTPWRRA